jgi:hypothetical protein
MQIIFTPAQLPDAIDQFLARSCPDHCPVMTTSTSRRRGINRQRRWPLLAVKTL